MKAKNSLSTGRRCLLAAAGWLLAALSLGAQEPWREGRNVSGLSFYDHSGAKAVLGGSFTSGGFRNPSDAPSVWSAGASASAERHFHDMVFTGDFSFRLQSMKDAMGSMFTKPGFYPVDLLEFTPGQKTMQTYGIGGGFAWKAGAWIPGATFRFEGINYAKRKDLRHTTYRQEFEAVPSVLYNGGAWRLGLSAILGRNSEFIQAEQVGSATAESYYAFLDKGMRYGTYQVWDGSGTHLADAGVDRFPVKQLVAGGALQGSLGDVLYADAEYRYSWGMAGEKGYDWFYFPGHDILGKVIWNIPSGGGVHVLRAEADWSRVESYETVLRRETEGGVTTPRLFGNNRVYAGRSLAGRLGYKFCAADGWEVEANGGLCRNKDLSTLMYPYSDLDESLVLDWQARAHVPIGPVELEAGLTGRHKVGEHRHVIEIDRSIGLVSEPFRLVEWWDWEQEVADIFCLGATLELRYNFTIAGKHAFWAEAGCSYLRAFGVVLAPGNYRQTTHLTIGYNF